MQIKLDGEIKKIDSLHNNIFHIVCDYNSGLFDNQFNIHYVDLRNKISENIRQPILETVDKRTR